MSKISEILEAAGLTGEKAAEAERSILEGYRSKEETDKAKARASELESRVEELTAEVGKLSDTSEADELRRRVADYERADEERKSAEAEEKARAEFRKAFDGVVGERMFANEYTAKAVFEAAYAKHKAFPDADPREIVDGLTKGDGVFANPQRDPVRQPVPQGGESAEGGSGWLELGSRLFGK